MCEFCLPNKSHCHEELSASERELERKCGRCPRELEGRDRRKYSQNLGNLICRVITLPETPLLNEQRHPYSHRPSRVDPGRLTCRTHTHSTWIFNSLFALFAFFAYSPFLALCMPLPTIGPPAGAQLCSRGTVCVKRPPEMHFGTISHCDTRKFLSLQKSLSRRCAQWGLAFLRSPRLGSHFTGMAVSY